ncbi:MAG: hypothetical protein ACI4WR_08230 [Bulleidia sp.]
MNLTLNQGLEVLSPEQCFVLLKEWEKHQSAAETAAVLGVSRSHAMRCLQEMNQILEGGEHADAYRS